jgi:hypothetical protein
MKGIIMPRLIKNTEFNRLLHLYRLKVSAGKSSTKKSTVVDVVADNLDEAKAKAIKRASLGKLHGHPRESMEIENILFI